MAQDDPYGYLLHLDKTGTPCAYCGEPSTHTFVVSSHDTLPDYRVGLCDVHHREPEPRVGNFRARSDRMAKRNQTAMDLDV